MKNTRKIGALICIVLVAILTLTGCSLNIGGTFENLYIKPYEYDQI